MTDARQDPQGPALLRLISEVKDQIARSKEDVPGWTLSRPSVAEIEDSFAFVRAESKDNEDAPFILPSEACEVSIAVLHGSVQISGYLGTLSAGRFFSPGPGDGREIRSLEPHTAIICTFFREARVADGTAGSATVLGA